MIGAAKPSVRPLLTKLLRETRNGVDFIERFLRLRFTLYGFSRDQLTSETFGVCVDIDL